MIRHALDAHAAVLDFTHLDLYGRDKEIAALQLACKGSVKSLQIVWLKGYSGVGKSALVEHVFQKEVYFCSGKFEKRSMSRPFSALADLLTQLCERLQLEKQMLHISTEDASALARVVPEVYDVLSIEFSDKEAVCNREWCLERLKQAVRSFCKAVCDASTASFIMFLDDLQWADLDSLEIIRNICTDKDAKKILFVGAFRINEVKECHPLARIISEIGALKATSVLELVLTNLDEHGVCQMVADLTHMPPDQVATLGKLIHSKTDGNCFFTLSVLRHINDKGLLYITSARARWKWDTDKIRAEVDLADNVVDFLTKRMQKLPHPIADALTISSFLGTKEVEIELVESLLPAL